MKKQNGVSLISTMIGLTLGMLSILAMMMLYKTLVQQSVSSNVFTKEDSETQSALISSQMQLQKAGYGIESNTNSCLGATTAGPSGKANTDIILLNNASLTNGTLTGNVQAISNTAATGNSVLYRWLENGVSTCSGIISTDTGVQTLLPQSCTNTSDYTTLSWTPYFIAGPKTQTSGNPLSFIATKVTSCNLYGKVITGNSVLLNLTGPKSISALGDATTTICLPNICQ